MNSVVCNLVVLLEESGFTLEDLSAEVKGNLKPCSYISEEKKCLLQKHMGLIILHSGCSTQGDFNQNFNSIFKALKSNHHSLGAESPDSKRTGNPWVAHLAPVFGWKVGWARQTRNPHHEAGAHVYAPRWQLIWPPRGRGRWAAEARRGWARPRRKKEKRAIRQLRGRKFQATSFQAPVSGWREGTKSLCRPRSGGSWERMSSERGLFQTWRRKDPVTHITAGETPQPGPCLRFSPAHL